MTEIAYAKIHPSIGIARVGNSRQTDGFYLGPQVTEPLPREPGAYRDATGALKREVAEFRIYAYDGNGRVVRELTMGPDTRITWTVELANHKAAWYDFVLALDIPEAATATPSRRRNAEVALPDRHQLAITPGARSIHTPASLGPEFRFGGGTFMGTEVPLGELRTDASGRLQVFGGHGRSASYLGQAPTTFANNDGWYDDTSDGPVTATVLVDGRSIAVVPAWVVVAPPNYGPQQKAVRTLYALMTDVAIQAGRLAAPIRPSFSDDILPILEAMCDLQWMNAGFAAGFGYGMPQHFLEPRYLTQLAEPGATYAELRRTVANGFRNPRDGDTSLKPWPWIYGDAMNVPMPRVPDAMNALNTAVAEGVVYDSIAGAPLADALVYVIGTLHETRTDSAVHNSAVLPACHALPDLTQIESLKALFLKRRNDSYLPDLLGFFNRQSNIPIRRYSRASCDGH